MTRIKSLVEAIIVNSRWLVAPFLLGLIVGLAALIYKFILKLLEFITELHSAVPTEVIVGLVSWVRSRDSGWTRQETASRAASWTHRAASDPV
jgi:uncharacterized membrane protein YqhA